MARAHPDAMRPTGPSRTRTAWPQRREGWWLRHGRNRTYVLFGLASVPVMLEAFLILGAVWSLGAGPEAWDRYVAELRSPLARAFHVVALPVFVGYGARFLRLFPKTQPPRVDLPGLAETWKARPSLRALARVTFSAWILASIPVFLLLGGWIP